MFDYFCFASLAGHGESVFSLRYGLTGNGIIIYHILKIKVTTTIVIIIIIIIIIMILMIMRMIIIIVVKVMKDSI